MFCICLVIVLSFIALVLRDHNYVFIFLTQIDGCGYLCCQCIWLIIISFINMAWGEDLVW